MDFFILDAGMSTVSCLALPALRMRVSISAMGSVICIWFSSYIRVTAAFGCRFRRRGSMPMLDWPWPFVILRLGLLHSAFTVCVGAVKAPYPRPQSSSTNRTHFVGLRFVRGRGMRWACSIPLSRFAQEPLKLNFTFSVCLFTGGRDRLPPYETFVLRSFKRADLALDCIARNQKLALRTPGI